jgi:hydrogenase nickel incorporation protein HypA/HybF
MHELSLAISIVEKVSEAALQNRAEKIISVRVLIGPLSGVIPESLEFCFIEACYDTIAEGASFIIEKSPLIIKCSRCEKESEVTAHHLLCPNCHIPDIKILSGKELKIIDLEVI